MTREQPLNRNSLNLRFLSGVKLSSADVVASAKRVLLDTLGCAIGAVGSEPANIAEATIRKSFGDGNTATVIGYPRDRRP